MSVRNKFYFPQYNFVSHLIVFISARCSLFFLIIVVLVFSSCGPSKRFTEKEDKDEKIEKVEIAEKEASPTPDLSAADIRVLLKGIIPNQSLKVESSSYLYKGQEKLALIKTGNVINCFDNNGRVKLTISSQSYEGEKFFLTPAEEDGIVKVNGKRYRGRIQISTSGNSIDIINVVNIEDYVKGVLAKEMPIGKDYENYEALKALAVCVRTYAQKKMKDGKIYFDIYDDTRDQVYGGADAENAVSNKAADETRDQILKYEDSQAIIFYHSTCGGFTESAENVFTKEKVPYLTTIKDGNEPYCKISPRFEWTETYSKELIISRLKNYSLLDNASYSLEDISIRSRFNSGRVNEMEIKVAGSGGSKKTIVISGNEIRSILKTADGKMILWGTMFDLSVRSNSVVLTGKGFGHGVGLCQWGAIALSRKGWKYKEILNHYYPNTVVGKAND